MLRTLTATLTTARLCAGLHVEELEYRADDGPDGWVPLRIVAPMVDGAGRMRRLPTVIFLHATGKSHVVFWTQDHLHA